MTLLHTVLIVGLLETQAVSQPLPQPSPAPVIAAMVAAQSSDLFTTCYGLSTGRFREGNPIFGSCAGASAVKAGTTGFAVWSYLKLRRKHPKMARVVFVATVAAGAIPAILNARNFAKHR